MTWLDVADEWIRRLESGEYKQGQCHLKRCAEGEVRWCCLGVLADVVVEKGVWSWSENFPNTPGLRQASKEMPGINIPNNDGYGKGQPTSPAPFPREFMSEALQVLLTNTNDRSSDFGPSINIIKKELETERWIGLGKRPSKN